MSANILRRGEGGQALVELALALPLALFVGLAAWQLLETIASQIALERAANVAARAFVLTGDAAYARAVAERSIQRGAELTLRVEPAGPLPRGSLVTVTATLRRGDGPPLVRPMLLSRVVARVE